jgi:Domain of unknown function(DUF2779)
MKLNANAAEKPYVLTKSKIVSGLQCHKKLWLDTNQPIKQELHIFYIGNRFGEFARTHYGEGCDLTGNLDAISAIAATQTALNDSSVPVIYEAAFLHDDTLVRIDVLRRNSAGWEMIEVKSSTGLKDEHIKDASVQAYIAQACGIQLNKIQIAHINKDFVYQGDGNYENLVTEADITHEAKGNIAIVPQWIAQLKPIATAGATMPETMMGDQCTKPYNCPHQDRCSAILPKLAEVPISILPYFNKNLIEDFAAHGIHDVRDMPASVLSNPRHLRIQEAHRADAAWFSHDIRLKMQSYSWPRYFMDFETVQQGVPFLTGTKAYDALPFQWSVHCWSNPSQKLNLEDGVGYLQFCDQNMDREFLESLLVAVGNSGPIFVHNASFERSKLRNLAKRPNCLDLHPAVEVLIDRIVDTLDIAHDGFYAPAMMGSYSLKNIVKAIPTSVDYSSTDGLSGGGEAQIAWFKCTDPSTTSNEKMEWEKKLKYYCAQDTLAMYDFIRYLENH